MFEKEAEEWADKEFEKYKTLEWYARKNNFQKGAEFGYNKAKIEVEDSYQEALCNSELNLASVTEQLEELEGKCKTSYIKGIRTMANALKDYDRTDGAWTDYFEHTVEKVLKSLLQESE